MPFRVQGLGFDDEYTALFCGYVGKLAPSMDPGDQMPGGFLNIWAPRDQVVEFR